MPVGRRGSAARRFTAGIVAGAALLSAFALTPPQSDSRALPWILGAAMLAALRPGLAMAALAAAVPTLTLVSAHLHGIFDWTSLLVLTLIAGAAMRRAAVRSVGPPRRTSNPLVVFALAILASLVVALFSVDVAFSNAPEILRRAHSVIVDQHLYVPTRFWPLYGASVLLQGLGLFWLAGTLAEREKQWTVRMLVVGGAIAAAFNMFEAAALVRRAADMSTTLWQLATDLRISAQLKDVNAAGSYFTIPFFAALELGRRPGRNRFWLIIAALTFVALWLTGSRAAIAASALALGILVFRTALASSVTPEVRRAAIAVVAAGALSAAAVLALMPEKFVGRSVEIAVSVRMEMGMTALRMAREDPLFGIGVGEFYPRSSEFMSPAILTIYPRENAHNNYLQILAELGIVGLGAFLWLLYASLGPRRGDLKGFWAEGRWNGLQVGLLVFLVTCLSGHPLLVPEVAFVFWIALGLSAADRQEAIGAAESSRRARLVAGVLCAFVLLSLPIRIASARQAKNLQDVVFGVSHWRRDAAGVPYRRLARDATFFIPASGTFVDMPLRLSAPSTEPVSVAISFDDSLADRVRLEGTDWRRVHLLLPHSTDHRWIRVRLMIEPATAPTVLLGTMDQR